MNWESTLVKNLNTWGVAHQGLTKLIANDFVYIAVALGLITFLYDQIRYSTKPFFSPLNIRELVTDGLLNITFPVGLAVLVSEIISKYVNRARPFVTDNFNNFLKHSADGGMPSHHMVFTVALAYCVIGFHRNIGGVILALALFSGIGRMAAAIHYPTDIIVGFALGLLVPYLYGRALNKLKISRKR
jgi:membrane-associated phospholipid phosphatase